MQHRSKHNPIDAPSRDGMARIFGNYYVGSHRTNTPFCTIEGCTHGLDPLQKASQSCPAYFYNMQAWSRPITNG